ncbi:MAG: patatin-like phospholipase family protein [Wenzhouxiangella sp.]|nr:patatin-like phospholipase family protein [Wenzhouxiangella sp.]
MAADLVTGEAVVIGNGDLVDAVRASMSVPGAFQPIRIGDRLLVDGGVVDNVPVDVARAMGADRLIVVDVGAGLASEEELGSPASVTMQVISILMERNTRQTLELLGERDLLIRPELGDIGSADFQRAVETLPLGEAAARIVIDDLQGFSANDQRLISFEARPHPRWTEDRRIDRVLVESEWSRTAFLVEDRLRPLIGEPASPRLVEQQIARLYGEGHYERITYTLEEDGEQLLLRVTPIDKSWGPNFLRLGLRLSDDFDGGSAYQLDALARLASDIRPGAEWRMRLALGELNELGGSWRVPMGRKAQTYLSPYANARALNQPLFIGDQNAEIARLRWTRGRIGADFGQDWNTSTRTFVRLERGQDRLSRSVGIGVDRFRDHYGFIGLGVVHDSLDDATFPHRGLLADGRLEFYQSWLGSTTNAEVARLELTQAWSAGRYIMLGGVRAVSAFNDDVSLQAVDFLGGLGNLSGYGERELAGPQLFLARGLLMRRIGDSQQLLSLPTYTGVSLEAGNVWNQRSDFDLADLIYAGSVYVGVGTPLGPMFLGYGQSSDSRRAIYLTFGSLIQSRQVQ